MRQKIHIFLLALLVCGIGYAADAGKKAFWELDAGNGLTPSDERLKENIVPTSWGLETLRKVQVHDFNFISDPAKQRKQGFIAQELYQIYPFPVSMGGDDASSYPWSVDYGKLTPLLTSAVQDLDKSVLSLSERVEKAEQKFSDIPSTVSGVTTQDTATGQPYCLKVTNGKVEAVPGKC